MRPREKLHPLRNRFTAICVHTSCICMHLIFSRFCRSPLRCDSIHYKIVMTWQQTHPLRVLGQLLLVTVKASWNTILAQGKIWLFIYLNFNKQLEPNMPNTHDCHHTSQGSVFSSMWSLTLPNVNERKHPNPHWTISWSWIARKTIFGLPSKVRRIPHQPKHSRCYGVRSYAMFRSTTMRKEHTPTTF